MPTVEYKYSSDGWTKVPTAKVIQGNKPINIEPGSVNNFVYGSFWLLSGVVYCVTLTW